MKKIFLVGMFTVSVFAFSSCGVSANLVSNQNQNQTSVVLSQNNYKVVGTAKGEVKSSYIMGIGGLSRKSLRENALGAMFQNAQLSGGARAVINANVTEKSISFLPFFTKRIMVAEGQIIEFIK